MSLLVFICIFLLIVFPPEASFYFKKPLSYHSLFTINTIFCLTVIISYFLCTYVVGSETF